MRGKLIEHWNAKFILERSCYAAIVLSIQCTSVPETTAPVRQSYAPISSREERFIALKDSRNEQSVPKKSSGPFPYKAARKPSTEQISGLPPVTDKTSRHLEKNLEVAFVQASGIAGANRSNQASSDDRASNKLSPLAIDTKELLNVWEMFRNSPKSSPRILQSTSDFIKKNPKSWFGYVKLSQFFYERNVSGEPAKILRDALGKVSDKIPIRLALVAFTGAADDVKKQTIKKVRESDAAAKANFTSLNLSELSKSESLDVDERLRILDTLSQAEDKNLTQSCSAFQDLFENGRPNREVTYYYARCLHLALNRDKALEVLSSGKRVLEESEIWRSESPRELLLAALLFLELGKPEVAREFWVSYERVSRSSLKSW